MFQRFVQAFYKDIKTFAPNTTPEKTDARHLRLDEWNEAVKRTSSTFTSPVPGRNVTTHRTERSTWFLKRVRIAIALLCMATFRDKTLTLIDQNVDISRTKDIFKNSINVINQWIDDLEGTRADEMTLLSSMFSVNMSSPDPAEWKGTEYGYQNVLMKFSHYQTIQYHKMVEYDFTGKSTRQVLDALSALDQEYKTEQKEDDRYIDEREMEDDVKVLIDFNDGFAWYDLQTSVSDDEARTMRHCCTDPRTEDGGTVYSLREKVKRKGRWAYKPHATFMIKEKALYEMKGFGNDKPNEKFHKYIVPLLESKYVEDIIGGGYMAGKNFSVLDLPEKIRKPLVKKKPGLLTMLEASKVFGPTSNEFKAKVHSSATKTYDFKYDKKYDGYILKVYKDQDEYWDEHLHKDSEYILEYYRGDRHFEHFDYDYNANEIPFDAGDLAGWCDDDDKKHIIQYAIENQSDAIEAQEIDVTGIEEVIILLIEEDEDFRNHVVWSVQDGDRIGAESQMTEALRNTTFGTEVVYFDEDSISGDAKFDVASLADGKVWQASFNWDVPVAIISDHQNMAKLITNYSEELDEGTDVHGKVKVEEPHYGWQDNDEDATREYFINMLQDNLTLSQ